MKGTESAVTLGRAFVLLLHLMVAVAAPVADAYIDARVAAFDYAHAEPEGSNHCPPAHDQLFCQLCRALDSPAASGISNLRFRASPSESAGFARNERPAPARAPLPALGPRGPPPA